MKFINPFSFNFLFVDQIQQIYKKYGRDRLNYFEHNLEVWRQLWRTTEISDILLVIVDSRYPLFHFSPSLYDYITRILKKPMILVFNKIDLIPASVLKRWKEYFSKRFPLIRVIDFSVYPNNVKKGNNEGGEHNEEEGEEEEEQINLKMESKRNRKEWKTRTRKYSSPLFSSSLVQKCLQELDRMDLFDEKFEQELIKEDLSGDQKDSDRGEEDDDSHETDEDEENQDNPKNSKNKKKNLHSSSHQDKLDKHQEQILEKEEEEHNKKDLKEKPFITIGLVVIQFNFFFFFLLIYFLYFFLIFLFIFCIFLFLFFYLFFIFFFIFFLFLFFFFFRDHQMCNFSFQFFFSIFYFIFLFFF